MKTNYVLLSLGTVLAVASLPAANADQASFLYCYQKVGTFIVDGQTICSPSPHGDTCKGLVVFVLTNDECHARDGPGCDGTQVFVLSDRNCYGSAGRDGCMGVRIILPESENNCKGGQGNATKAVFRMVR